MTNLFFCFFLSLSLSFFLSFFLISSFYSLSFLNLSFCLPLWYFFSSYVYYFLFFFPPYSFICTIFQSDHFHLVITFYICLICVHQILYFLRLHFLKSCGSSPDKMFIQEFIPGSTSRGMG